ncbi:MAG TPA: hypothetical protein VK004_00330, partial [Ignavibacteria bacterium]|nr:hypothetical protein [Ignavibacteria bacterium]
VFNLLMNAFIGYLVFRFIKDKQYLYTNKNFLVLIIWLIIFYAMLVILGLETRFGELYYLLLIPIVFCIIKAGISPLLKKSLYVYLGFYLIFGVFGYFSILGSENIGYYVAKFSRSKKLVDNLVTLNKANQRSVLVNDIAGGFGSQFLPEFVGTQKDLVKINSISFDDPDGLIGSGFSLITPTDNDSVQLIVTLPDGVKFQFEGIDMKLFEHKERDWIKRTEKIWYRFPNEKITGVSQSTGTSVYDLGNVMEVKYMVDGLTCVIYYNPSTAEYDFALINYKHKQ